MIEECRPIMPYPLTPYPKLIINAAITGMIPMKKDTPHVPISVDEIIKDAGVCIKAGASMIHIHARDDKGVPTYKKEIYEQMIRGIRKNNPDVIICASLSGRLQNTFEARSEVLELDGDVKPDMGSLTMGSLNFPEQASVNSPEMIQQLATKMLERGIIPELEIFESGAIGAVKVFILKGILKPPYYFNLLLGNVFTAPATMFDLTNMVQSLPSGVQWAAAGIGKFQQKMNFAAILMGGHVRVGLEDNIFYDAERTTLATNEMLISRIVRFSEEIKREVATPIEAREMLGFPPAIGRRRKG